MHHSKDQRSNSQHNLLGLPVELKRLVYTFCYDHPHSVQKQYDQEYAASNRLDPPAYWPAELYTPCQHPRSHLSLYFTCRQLRNELFPVFAEHHVLNMSNVFLSTEETIVVNPLYRFQEIHHIMLRFPTNGNICACSLSGRASHFCIDLRTNVEKDICNFISAIKTCEARLRLESVELELSLPCNATSDAFSQYRALFRSVVYLAEALSQRRHETVRDTQRLLMQVIWPSNTKDPLKARLGHIAKTSWDRVPDGSLMLERDCTKCSSMDLPIERHTHKDNWADIDDVLSAIDGYRTRRLTYPGVYEPKPWKIVFQPGGGFKYFSHAMVELERRRQVFV